MVSYIAALLIAAGLNIGYEFHPQYLGLSLLVSAAGIAAAFLSLSVAGVRSIRLRLGLGGLLIAVLFGAVIVTTELGDRRARQQAERLDTLMIAAITPFPGSSSGATRTGPTPPNSDTIAAGYLNQNGGWTSERLDDLPNGVHRDAVVRHYLREMRSESWRVRVFRNGRDRELLGRRGRALLSVYVEPRESLASVWVDHDGNRLCSSPSDSGCW